VNRVCKWWGLKCHDEYASKFSDIGCLQRIAEAAEAVNSLSASIKSKTDELYVKMLLQQFSTLLFFI
jgi:hypothetical protein